MKILVRTLSLLLYLGLLTFLSPHTLAASSVCEAVLLHDFFDVDSSTTYVKSGAAAKAGMCAIDSGKTRLFIHTEDRVKRKYCSLDAGEALKENNRSGGLKIGIKFFKASGKHNQNIRMFKKWKQQACNEFEQAGIYTKEDYDEWYKKNCSLSSGKKHFEKFMEVISTESFGGESITAWTQCIRGEQKIKSEEIEAERNNNASQIGKTSLVCNVNVAINSPDFSVIRIRWISQDSEPPVVERGTKIENGTSDDMPVEGSTLNKQTRSVFIHRTNKENDIFVHLAVLHRGEHNYDCDLQIPSRYQEIEEETSIDGVFYRVAILTLESCGDVDVINYPTNIRIRPSGVGYEYKDDFDSSNNYRILDASSNGHYSGLEPLIVQLTHEGSSDSCDYDIEISFDSGRSFTETKHMCTGNGPDQYDYIKIEEDRSEFRIADMFIADHMIAEVPGEQLLIEKTSEPAAGGQGNPIFVFLDRVFSLEELMERNFMLGVFMFGNNDNDFCSIPPQ